MNRGVTEPAEPCGCGYFQYGFKPMSLSTLRAALCPAQPVEYSHRLPRSAAFKLGLQNDPCTCTFTEDTQVTAKGTRQKGRVAICTLGHTHDTASGVAASAGAVQAIDRRFVWEALIERK